MPEFLLSQRIAVITIYSVHDLLISDCVFSIYSNDLLTFHPFTTKIMSPLKYNLTR
ncbi:uncharacterized protein ASCRUDRAFT_77401 [Ascoidea rubescens DSM 1968]|uniref:Uncharacterized protein n=1 Tax=Ascoidea rubescens DSM 1968 TaxID=1344418 RepID=A0A1D2VBD1_9ASCO|nr:hypothetical protein ASCRUDRAFT_77401 [Ascoidea rubescens DSM 1968]ODV58978.1 hypothetical protein ASCRUDRAFT_77401 [Ascoidea rubescens DSM 1968]